MCLDSGHEIHEPDSQEDRRVRLPGRCRPGQVRLRLTREREHGGRVSVECSAQEAVRRQDLDAIDPQDFLVEIPQVPGHQH